MVLHIFNPEHDIALACNLSNFTPPYAARKLRAALGFLPALWAGEGDAILVDDVTLAEQNLSESTSAIGNLLAGVSFVTERDLYKLDIDEVSVWGWDAALCRRLVRHGVEASILPSAQSIYAIRELSHRRTAALLLGKLKGAGLVGEAFVCNDYKSVCDRVAELRRVVIKTPWSSSGRGVRFVYSEDVDEHFCRWIENVLCRQGCVIVEPYYNKVMDFGMEFYCDGSGHIDCLGLSIFNTSEAEYTGNLIASEEQKSQLLSNYLPFGLLDSVRDCISHELGILYCGRYQGPFGVDMMIVDVDGNGNNVLHPCVEINLRRTMGHVALALSQYTGMQQKLMHIELGNNYKLKIEEI